MVNRKLTLKCSQFPKGVKGISPDDEKNMSVSEIISQKRINEQYNSHAIEIGDYLQTILNDVDITWINDGSFVVSTSSTILKLEQVIDDLQLQIVTPRLDIKHKVRKVDPNNENSDEEEDIDEILIKDISKGENKLKLGNPIVNQYKSKRIV